MLLVDKTVKEYVSEAMSGDPTPGGGSVAALVGSLGGALTNMVGNLTIGKKVYEDVPPEMKEKMEENFKKIEKVVEELNLIIDRDASAFDKAMDAFKLPKTTDEEKKIRSQAIQEGYKAALEVPLACAQECFKILELQDVFAHYGNIGAITDVGVGTLLAYAGIEGALFNVIINLKSIKDEDYAKKVNEKVDALMANGKTLRDEMLKVVYSRLG
ncbi:cyclodeaminase/cyclohydrolase family protein [Tissierella creatinini]|nr:cyclodeaminase/cyclohydrolase family protein [Tissierella creatinini]TJX61911.1 cyclodeaminase/cyclohydrolase family protein [Soehngenia saccharolytica]